MYTQNTFSGGNADQCLLNIVQYASCRQKWSALFPNSKSVWPVLEITRISEALKGMVTQTLAFCNIVPKRRAKDKLYEVMEYDFLVSFAAKSLKISR